MSADPLERLGDRLSGPSVEAIVAVEQARAVAQVAAQVQVAQRFPRDPGRVRRELEAACRSYDLAAVAFWALPNRGQGLSVHLARELVTIWGNVDAGVHELRRDDVGHMSEVQAFAWDLERNSRNTRTFQVPHAIMKDKRRQPIEDLQDVYRNNQNVGARAYRECVFAILPRELVDDAERRLRETLHRGPGKPLEARRVDAVGWFAQRGVTREQLERRIGRPVDEWTPEDVGALEVVARSITRGETTTAEQFDDDRVRADELDAGDPTDAAPRDVSPPAPAEPSHPAQPDEDPRPATQRAIGWIIGRLRDLDVESGEDQRAWLSRELGRDVDTRKRITRGELARVERVLEVLEAERGEQPPDLDPDGERVDVHRDVEPGPTP